MLLCRSSRGDKDPDQKMIFQELPGNTVWDWKSLKAYINDVRVFRKEEGNIFEIPLLGELVDSFSPFSLVPFPYITKRQRIIFAKFSSWELSMRTSTDQKLKNLQEMSRMNHNRWNAFNQNVESQHIPLPKMELDENGYDCFRGILT